MLTLSMIGCTSPIIRNPLFRLQAVGLPQPKVGVQPPLGVLYDNTRAPMSTTWNATPVGGKEGTSTTRSIGIPFLWGGALRGAWGDGSIEAAQQNGGISKVNYTEYSSWSILSVYTKTTTHVYGE